MEISFKPGPNGFVIQVGSDSNDKLTPNPTVDQNNPKDVYVYAHTDKDGNYFYIGKGRKRRAWARKNRHLFWHKYVTDYLDNQFTVLILEDNLTEDDSLVLESKYMHKYSEQIVNWVNWNRSSNLSEIERFHKLRDLNRELMRQAKEMENTNIEDAIDQYKLAIENTKEYAFIDMSDLSGLLGMLQKEDREIMGYNGELEAIHRISICLSKVGRHLESSIIALNYFKLYRCDLIQKRAENTHKRIVKGLLKIGLHSEAEDYLKTINSMIPILPPYYNLNER